MGAIGLVVVVVARGTRGSLVIAHRVAAGVAVFSLWSRRGGLWLRVGAGGGQVDDARARRGPYGGGHVARAWMVDDGISGAKVVEGEDRTGVEETHSERAGWWAVWCR